MAWGTVRPDRTLMMLWFVALSPDRDRLSELLARQLCIAAVEVAKVEE